MNMLVVLTSLIPMVLLHVTNCAIQEVSGNTSGAIGIKQKGDCEEIVGCFDLRRLQ
jgi:hypothetical protein